MADYLLDTNVLLRFSDAASPVHATAVDAVAVLLSRGDRVYITAQNLIEFWAVATGPVERPSRKRGRRGDAQTRRTAGLGDKQVMVGTLAEQERVLYFEYDSAFIAKPLPPRDHERAEKERLRHHQPLRRR